MKKLYFIYTIPDFYNALYKPVMYREFERKDDLIVRFTADTSLLQETLANNVIPSKTTKQRLFGFAKCAEADGADCIVVGCTAINTATKEISQMLETPMFSIDEPMIQAVLADGHKKIAVLSHTPINAGTIKRRLLAEDPGLTVDLYPVEGAKEAFEKGDMDELRALLKKGAENIPEGYDCIVCGHISAEDTDFSRISVPVYRTGEYAIKAINRSLKG
ncbi:MAG: aspartate/glutamate racemase family protein [Erysipelotrichaceae bacterium]|nr:aspartate/glutamate racemase family protein [Erysipelotrichaceae bacterium]